jgi:hypothetical protein
MPQNLIRVRNSVLVGGVARSDEDQARSRCGGSRDRAVAPRQQSSDPVFRLLAASDRQQRADDIPDHVVQEGVRLHLDVDLLPFPAHFDLLQFAPGVGCLAMDGTERGEIVLAQQGLRGAVHGVGVQRAPLPAEVLATQGRPHRPVQDAVPVPSRTCGEACVKVARHRHAPADADRRRQARRGAQHPATWITFDVGIEMHDLACGMDACIGASRAHRIDVRGRDEGQRRLQRLLHGRRACLAGRAQALPAEEVAAVVFDAQRVPHR